RVRMGGSTTAAAFNAVDTAPSPPGHEDTTGRRMTATDVERRAQRADVERAAMARALELALLGPRGFNPQVGAVILSPDGRVLAEGWHQGAGTPHAEVDALSKLAPGG